jgi:asparagine synthase (glutamine-hydrolysing)
MSGICGWLTTKVSRLPPEVVIASMAEAADDNATAAPMVAHGKTAAVAAIPSLIPVDLYQQDGIVSAIEGYVSWTTPELEDIARARGPAAAAANAYAREGADCLARMRGPFAVAVVDTHRHRALLAIDRLGIRSLNFAQQGDTLVFGTRADHVIAHPDSPRRISHQALFDYLYCHVVPSPGSIYEGVSKLLPGERLEFQDGNLKRSYYWHLAYVDRPSLPMAELKDRFRHLLRQSVARSVHDGRVGAFLSGGTDSSTVVGLLTEARGRPIDTYSIGFEVAGFDEMEYARITASHFGTRPHEYYLTPSDLADAIPPIAAAFDEPFGNASAVAAYYCAKMAREDGKRLLLAGDGGDEIFGGNARYAKQRAFEAYGILPLPLRRRVIEPIVLGMPPAAMPGPLRKLQSYVRQAKVPLPDRIETYNFLERESLDAVFEPEFLSGIERDRPLAFARDAYGRTASSSAINRMMHLDLKQTLADNDLRKVNVACALAGIAPAFPLLDEELVEFSGIVPPGLKVKGLTLRYFFKEALRDFLPAPTLAKRKHGFGLPFGVWLRSDRRLRAIAQDALASLRRRGIVRPSYLDHLSAMHDNEHASYYGVMIWVLMMMELWLSARDH